MKAIVAIDFYTLCIWFCVADFCVTNDQMHEFHTRYINSCTSLR